MITSNSNPLITKTTEVSAVEEQYRSIPLGIKIGLFLNLFVSILASRGLIDIYYGYFAYLFLFPQFLAKYKLPKQLLWIMGVLFVTGTFYSFLGLNDFLDHLKVMLGLTASYLFFYFIVAKSNFKLQELFRFYLSSSLFCAGLGVFQMLTYLLGHPVNQGIPWLFGKMVAYSGGTFGIRISTFFGEPSYYAIFLSGAVFVALHDFLFQSKKFYFNRFTAIILFVGVYFAFSGTFIGTLGISLFLILLNYGIVRYGFLFIPLALLALPKVLESSDEFSTRYEGTLGIFLDNPAQELNVFKYHGSSVILYNNFYIAWENFKRNPLFGTGIGSHPVAYEKYSLTKNVLVFGFALNQRDANSMFNRLMSETGLFGLGLFAWLLLGHYVKKKGDDNNLWLISNACMVVILINLGRQGNFFLNGFPFYVWMYYFAYKEKLKLKD